MNNNYIINENTLYLKQKDEQAIIQEKKTVIEQEKIKTKKIVEESTIFYGCSFKGRKEGTKALINESYKLPIMISETKNLIAFPLMTEKKGISTWILYNQIEKYIRVGNSKVLVDFKGGYQTTFHVSYYVFHNQILKCSRFLDVYRSRNQ